MMGIDQESAREWRAHWPTVLASMVGMSFTTVYIYSAGAMVQPIEREFGWTRAAIGSGITAVTAVAALLGPVMGAVVDRYGPRRVAVPGVLLFCAVLAMLSLTTPSLWTWLALWMLVGIGGLGIKPAVWTTAIAGLFRRSRGLALAVTLSGTGLGSILTPVLTTLLIDRFGWRGAFVGIAAIWCAVGFPTIYFLFRDAADKDGRDRAAPRAHEPGPSARGAIVSRRFLALTLAAMMFSLVAMSLIVSLIPLLTAYGISRMTAASLAATIGVTSVIGRLTTGYLLDRFEPRFIAAVAMIVPVVTFTLLLAMPGSVPFALAAVLVMGLSLGAEVDAVAFLIGHYFGTRHYGLLFGTIMSGLSIATGSAPLIAGYVYDVSGGYDPLLVGAMPLCVIASLLILTLGRATPPKHAMVRID